MKSLPGVLVLLAFTAGGMLASSLSYTGTFATDDQLQEFTFTLNAIGSITLETLSFGGGTNSASQLIPAGGFNTNLTLFQFDGTEIASDNGSGGCVNQHQYLGEWSDACISGIYGPGSYVLVLTQYGNTSLGDLSDGFSETGNPGYDAVGGCAQFCDALSGNPLNGSWAVDLLGVASPSGVPEPASIVLTGAGLVLVDFTRKGFLTRKRRT